MISDELDPRQKIELAKILMDEFNEGDWNELLTMTDCIDFARGTRFFQDVHWRNEGLKQGCIHAVNNILQDPNNLKFIWEFDNLQGLIKRKNESLHEAIRRIIDNDQQGIVPQPNIQTPNQLFHSAIKDAEKAVSEGEPQNAIDRIHTATHAHLQHLCKKNGISFTDEAITGLIVKLRENYKTVHNATNDDPIVKIIIGAGNVYQGLNTLRNHNSMTHPGNTLLDSSDAQLAINMSRTLMSYLDKKL